MNACGQARYKKIQGSERTLAELEHRLDDPMQFSEEFLLKLVQDNKDTEFGRQHGFADIHSIADYQRRVPLSTYDDYADAIYRMTEKGETNIITAYPVHHYNKSSGSMGNPKRIPLSDPAMATAAKYAAGLNLALLTRFFGDGWIDRKSLNLVETPATIATLPSGATHGSISARLCAHARPTLAAMCTSPLEAAVPQGSPNTKYLHALYALRYKDLSFIGCTFFSFLLEELRYIQGNWRRLVDDIEAGVLDERCALDEETRARLERDLPPMPERARELRGIFSQGFDEPFVPKVWPNCLCMTGVGSGGFKTYADKIRTMYAGDGIPFLKSGICSSEAIYSVPYALDHEDGVLVPDGLFLEFLPLDAGGDPSKAVTIDGLEVGRDYEVILTNLSGFYRYRIRDSVRVIRRHHNTPTVQFIGRIDQTISIMGEKTTDAALNDAVCGLAEKTKLDVVDFSVFPDLDAEPVRYVIFLEIASNPAGVRPKEIWKILEGELARANPSMGEKMRGGTCGHVRVQFLEPQAYALYQDLMLERGGNAGQVKPPHIVVNEFQRRFFFGLSDYMYEYVR